MGKEQEKGETSLNSKNNRSNPKKEKKRNTVQGKEDGANHYLKSFKISERALAKFGSQARIRCADFTEDVVGAASGTVLHVPVRSLGA